MWQAAASRDIDYQGTDNLHRSEGMSTYTERGEMSHKQGYIQYIYIQRERSLIHKERLIFREKAKEGIW